MCQPGKPTPQGLGHSIWRLAPGGESFQSAKSVALRLPSTISTRAPARRPAASSRARRPYAGNFSVSKYTPSPGMT